VTAPGTIARIWTAPVKGLSLVGHEAVEITPSGIPGDRRYALFDAGGRLANGKRFGPLVRIVPALGDDPDWLGLRFPDGSTLEGTVELGDHVDARFYGSTRPGRLVTGPWAAAIAAWAGEPVTLVRMEAENSGLDRADEGGSVSILSSAALEELARAGGLTGPLDSRRFRMSFVIDGVPAHAEDGWLGQTVRIGDAVVRPGGNIGRCAVTAQDPDTGIRSVDTLALIAETRGHLPTTESLPFGVWATVVAAGRARVGDRVEVLDDTTADDTAP
jgi:uncharacterized protein YcbX